MLPPSRLSDLGELLQTIRDPMSRTYAAEAVSAHFGGAQRAAIVSLWIAVMYDILAKVRELALGGDPAAARLVQQVDGTIARNDISQFLHLESTLLTEAHDQFEFLDAHEFKDLDRLREDRNRCAHPAYAAADALFEPTPEAVRAHLAHAILHLLRHQPVQGRSALARMFADIVSPTFPSIAAEACVFLDARYLGRAKPALVRNGAARIVKALLRGDDPDLPVTSQAAMRTALVAICRRHPLLYEEVMRDHLPRISGSLPDERLSALLDLAATEQRTWSWIDEPTRIRLKQHLVVRETGLDRYRRFGSLLNIEEMWPTLIRVLKDDGEPPEAPVRRQDVVNAAITRYRLAGSFRAAEAIGESLVLPLAAQLSPDDVTHILEAVSENAQICCASGTPRILVRLFDATTHHLAVTRSAWVEMLKRGRRLNGESWSSTLSQRLEIAGATGGE